MRGIETKTKASFADIISFCNDTKSERGTSPMACNDLNLETISLRSRSPPSFKHEQSWQSPRYKEPKEQNGFAVLDMVEKNWKVSLRSKIESDLSTQVQQALAPIVTKTNQKKWTEKKKSERPKNYHMINFGGGLRQGHMTNSRIPVESSGGGGGSFKYIDVNYISQNRVLTGADPIYGKDLVSRSLANLRLPKRTGLHSQAMYGLEDIARSQKHSSNMRGGLDVTLLDANDSNLNFLGLPNKHGVGNTLRPLIPNVIAYNGLSLPNYGASRRCFQTYTKDGMNSLLNSRTRRGKLTHMGHGKYVDKRGVIISRLGPFWPQGYGPVCQCPVFTDSCPKQENLNAHATDEASRIIEQELSSQKPTQAGFLKQSLRGKDDRPPVIQRVNFRSSDLSYLDSNSNKNNHHHHHHSNNHSHNATHNSHNAPGNIHNAATAKPQLWRGKPVIYDCERSSRSPLPHSVPEGFDESLIFESRFESGNLRQVRRTGAFEYELVLRTDMYTNRHTQWYYFRIQKPKRDRIYKFNIINFLKKDSLYNYGMKPLVYSENLANEEGQGWHRSGENIKYSSWTNPTRNAILSLDLQYYCLEYEIQFDWESVETDTIYMAHCYPYTYSDLRRHLDELMKDPDVAKHVKKEVLCETTAGNACFLLTITDFPDKEKDKYKDFHLEKKGVVITGRVHPGESQASWMMKGVIDYLTSDYPSAVKLRQKFIFKIVPMLNPDGVIVGNYRTSLAARDLNRNYRHPKQGTFPTIWHTKQMVDQFNKDHPIILYCDLHGHSRKHMVFMYGCDRRSLIPKEKGGKTEAPRDPLADARDFVEERMFPWLLYKLTPTRFSFNSTKFSVRRSKESTGRVVMFKQMKILNSFTMEASFSGTQFSKDKGRHFNIKDFQLMGRKLCECVLEYSRVCDDPVAKSRAVLEMTHEVARRLITTQKIPPADVNLQSLKSKSNNQINNETLSSPKKTSSSAPPNQNIATSTSTTQQKSCNKQATTNNIKTEQMSVKNTSGIEEIKTDENGDVNETGDDVILEETSINYGPIADQAENAEKIPDLDENCLRMLQQLNVREAQLESETSSESNSDTDPEEPVDIRGSKSKLRGSQEGSGRKKKKKKRQQKFGKSISAPSNIQPSHHSNRMTSEENNKEIAAKNVKTNYPGFVNKYANRSNGGIPIFAQERIKQRAARRLAELKVAEEDRRQQEEELREQLLLSGIQDGPNIPVSGESEGYSNICGIRYKVGSQPRRVHYMLYNPYRGQSPSKDRRPLLTMRFSPPSQNHKQNGNDVTQRKTLEMDGVIPYRVQAPAGRLSNQRRLGSLAELSASSSEPSSSQSSYQNGVINDDDVTSNDESKNADEVEIVSVHENENEENNKFNPRSVVVPIKNLSFKIAKKTTWVQRPSYVTCVPRPGQGFPDRDLNSPDSNHNHDDRARHPVASELLLPPNMEYSDVMTAHMRYPTQVHRVEGMKPRGKTFSRGPPMVFGEPVVMNQKAMENAAVSNPAQNNSSGHQMSQFLVRSASMPFVESNDDIGHVANANSTTYDERYGLTNHGRESAWANQVQVNFNVGVVSETEEILPTSGSLSERESKENRCNDVMSDNKSERYPFTVR